MKQTTNAEREQTGEKSKTRKNNQGPTKIDQKTEERKIQATQGSLFTPLAAELDKARLRVRKKISTKTTEKDTEPTGPIQQL